MEMQIYNAVVENNRFEDIVKADMDYECHVFRRFHEDNNILHLAAMYERHEIAISALKLHPHLTSKKNSRGNTPLHIIAQMPTSVDVVREFCDRCDPSHWKIQDSAGNTPLHVALIHDNLDIARLLVERDLDLALILNHSHEAPLHLVFQHYIAANFYDIKSVKIELKHIVNKEAYSMTDEESAQVERILSLMNLLLEKESCVACWRDSSGLTPLLRAVSLGTPYNIWAIETILKHCPLAVEVCDDSGKTILHHLINKLSSDEEAKKLIIDNVAMYSLRHHQDQQGNTALHLAAINKDVVMVSTLLNAGVKLGLLNKEGFSAAYWIRQNNMLEKMKLMGWDTVQAAENADVYSLREKLNSWGKDFLSLRDSQGRNLLHKLMLIKHRSVLHSQDFLDFIKLIVDMLPQLICQTDDKGDTPVHVLAQNDTYRTQINMASEQLEKHQYCAGEDQLISPEFPLQPETNLLMKLIDLCNHAQAAAESKPWFKLNDQGNAPLHLAILSKNYQVAEHLATVTENSDIVVNNRKETGLHLLARLPTGSMDEETLSSLILKLNKGNRLLDKERFTPVVRAFAAGNFEFAKLLYSNSMSVRVPDNGGLTFWHRLVDLPKRSTGYDFANSPFANKSGQDILKKADKKGNTPLHLAIKRGRFDLAQVFLRLGGHDGKPFFAQVFLRLGGHDGKPFFNRDLLDIRNNEGLTPGEMLGSLPNIPHEFDKSVRENATRIGIRSKWGIPVARMKDYVDTLGVIAALLTTITFTAAFAVPGGFDQAKGTPLLIKDAAFQVFLICDILSMCLSMLVLICLLWIMTGGSTTKSVVLLDLSISLLLWSFYTALLTFMTGIYATTHVVKPWVGIFSFFPCTMLTLLKHQYFLTEIMVPCGEAVSTTVNKFFQRVTKLCKKIKCPATCCQRRSRSQNSLI